MPARANFLLAVFNVAPAINRVEPCGSPSQGDASCAWATDIKPAHISAATVIVNGRAKVSYIVTVLRAKLPTRATDMIVSAVPDGREWVIATARLRELLPLPFVCKTGTIG